MIHYNDIASYIYTIEIQQFASTTTVDCANALFQGWVSRYGVPAVITSDRGAQFTSSLWAALCSLLNIQHNQTTAYNPQSNGMIERFHGRLKDALRIAHLFPNDALGGHPFKGSAAQTKQIF